MENKNNVWKLTTFFLIGLMIGFVTARSLPPQTLIEDAQASETNTLAADSPSPVHSSTLETVDYTKIPSSKDENGHWTLGSKGAKVVIEDFSDYECVYCHAYVSEAFPSIINNYVKTGKVYYVFNNFPLSFHPHAKKAAEAALCAGDQNKYWEMHHALFANQHVWNQGNEVEVFAGLAKDLSMDEHQFRSCLQTEKYKTQVGKDIELGTQRGVSGTPSFFINGQQVVGAQSYEYFKDVIEKTLK